MKFTHLADVHIGCWRHPKMKRLSVQAFREACEQSIEEDVDFILIAGDLFHTAIPSIDLVKDVIRILRSVRNADIPVYFIAGSHDFSPTGKTMLDVIEEANLGTNVARGDVEEDGTLLLKFTEDEDTEAKITGVIGKAGMLDRKNYEALDKQPLEDEEGHKIFLFHTAIKELKPTEIRMESSGVDFLPKGFDYYAGGHVHIVREGQFEKEGYENVVYPGPLFPTNFGEIETLKNGGYYVYNDGELQRKEVPLKDVVAVEVSVNDATPQQAKEQIYDALNQENVEDSIVLLRVNGHLVGGRTSDIGFGSVYEDVMSRGAYYFAKNTGSLTTESFNDAEVEERDHETLENELIEEHLGMVENPFNDEFLATKQLIQALQSEKQDGETNQDYEERIVSEAAEIVEENPERDEQVELEETGSEPENHEESTPSKAAERDEVNEDVESEEDPEAKNVEQTPRAAQEDETKRDKTLQTENPQTKKQKSEGGDLSSFLE
jgi:hypothetical protein